MAQATAPTATPAHMDPTHPDFHSTANQARRDISALAFEAVHGQPKPHDMRTVRDYRRACNETLCRRSMELAALVGGDALKIAAEAIAGAASQ